MLKQKQIRPIIEKSFSSIDENMERIQRAFDLGLMPKTEVLDRSVEIAENAETSLSRTLYRFCTEENISWDQVEWDHLRNAILKHCKLRPVPYEYHPVDLGFDEITESFLISHGGLGRLQELYVHPDPIGKTFLLKLKLKNKVSFVWVDYRFEVTSVDNAGDDNRTLKRFEGIGRFPGYHGDATIDITETDDLLLTSLYQKVYPVPDDPIWLQRKEETITGYLYTTELPGT